MTWACAKHPEAPWTLAPDIGGQSASMPLISEAPIFVELESEAHRGGARGPGSLSDAVLSPSLPPLQPLSPTLVQATWVLDLAVHVPGALFSLPSAGQLLPILQLKGPLLNETLPFLSGV